MCGGFELIGMFSFLCFHVYDAIRFNLNPIGHWLGKHSVQLFNSLDGVGRLITRWPAWSLFLTWEALRWIFRIEFLQCRLQRVQVVVECFNKTEATSTTIEWQIAFSFSPATFNNAVTHDRWYYITERKTRNYDFGFALWNVSKVFARCDREIKINRI